MATRAAAGCPAGIDYLQDHVVRFSAPPRLAREANKLRPGYVRLRERHYYQGAL